MTGDTPSGPSPRNPRFVVASVTVTRAQAVSDRTPHPVAGPYVETFYLPIVGPTVWALARWAQHQEPGTSRTISGYDLAAAIGVPSRPGLRSNLVNAMQRLATHGFGCYTLTGQAARLIVVSHMPDVPYHRQGSWPAHLRALHDIYPHTSPHRPLDNVAGGAHNRWMPAKEEPDAHRV